MFESLQDSMYSLWAVVTWHYMKDLSIWGCCYLPASGACSPQLLRDDCVYFIFHVMKSCIVLLSRDVNKCLFIQIGHWRQTKEMVPPKSSLVNQWGYWGCLQEDGWEVTYRRSMGSLGEAGVLKDVTPTSTPAGASCFSVWREGYVRMWAMSEPEAFMHFSSGILWAISPLHKGGQWAQSCEGLVGIITTVLISRQ